MAEGAVGKLKLSANSSSGGIDLILDNNQLPHITYQQDTDMLLASKNGGSWSSTIFGIGSQASNPQIAFDSTNSPVIGYGWYNGTIPAIAIARQNNGSWTFEDIATGDINWSSVSFALDGNERGHLAWAECFTFTCDSAGLVYAAEQGDGSWQFSTAVSSDSGYSFSIDLKVDENNTPHLLHTVGGKLQYTTKNQSGTWENSIVTESVIQRVSFDVDSQGDPHVLYLDSTTTVWYALKQNDSWQTEFINASAFEIALAVDQNNNPHLVYSRTIIGVSYLYKENDEWHWHPLSQIITPSGITITIDDNDNLHLLYIENDDINYVFKAMADNSYLYKSFFEDQYKLYPFIGNRVAFLVDDPTLDANVMQTISDVFDSTLEYYAEVTQMGPTFDQTYGWSFPIAEVAMTCTLKGCGTLGLSGIELTNNAFDDLYLGVRDNNEFDTELFFQFGRTFYFYSDQTAFNSSSMVTGFAVFMRSNSVEATGVSPAPINGVEFNDYENEIKNLLYTYLADPDLNWENSLQIGVVPPNQYSLLSSDFFASFLFKLEDMFGDEFVNHIWVELDKRPAATTTQEALDNFYLAASAATGKNLTGLFEAWKWPVSATAVAEATTRFGANYFPGDVVSSYAIGRPGSVFTLTATGFPPNSVATLTVNTIEVASNLPVDATGTLKLNIDTSNVGEGSYDVAISVNPSATVRLELNNSAPLRTATGEGPLIELPEHVQTIDHLIYLPLIIR